MNHARPGAACAPVAYKHGRVGHVQLTTSVPPELKDHLVEFCEMEGVTMKHAIERALREFLYEARA